ncbi:MAG: TrkH family potassium uptake protein [Bacteroidales bacterium]|nr:TrkH family potassium uptake protein [Bacteroidales bacterium]
MTIKSISINVGKALQVNALFMMLSVGVSIIYGMDSGFTPLLISCLITMIFGSFPLIFGKKAPQNSLQDGFITIVLSWLLSFIFGMLPYVLWGGEFTLMNAWFESVSGYTTTGSTILTDIERLPKSLLFWRSSTHFIGGLGVIIFLLLILPDASPFKLKLSHLELSAITKDGYRYKSSKTVRVITSVYLGLTAVGILSLWLAGMDIFDAVNHSFSTVATGGFSTRNTSIMYYDSTAINIVLMILMTLSAMHFGLIYAIFATRSLKPMGQSINRYYLSAILVLSVMVTISLMGKGGYDSFGKAVVASSFQVISYITTTGFGQSDNSAWPVLANALLLFAAFHCGCSGSTTGGIKADRMFIAFKAIGGEFKKRLAPSSIFRTKIGSSAVPEETVSSVFLYIVLYIAVLFLSFIAVLFTGAEIGDAFSGVLASIGNVGPGIGSLGTMGNYAAQPEAAKFIYTLDMFMGRLEIFPILIVISMLFKRER